MLVHYAASLPMPITSLRTRHDGASSVSGCLFCRSAGAAAEKVRYENAVAFQLADGSFILGLPEDPVAASSDRSGDAEASKEAAAEYEGSPSEAGTGEGSADSELDDLSSMQSMETDMSSEDSNYSLTDPLLSPRYDMDQYSND